MKYIKYIICFFALMTVFIFAGDIFQNYLLHFQDVLPTTIITLTQNDISNNAFLDIDNIARKHETGILLLDAREFSDYEWNVDIYYGGTLEKETIKKIFQIEEKKYPSFFFTQTTVVMQDFALAANLENSLYICFVGSDNQVLDCYNELSSIYLCGNFKTGDQWVQENQFLFIAWMLPIIVVFLLSYYDMMRLKKEHYIRYSLGENGLKIFAVKAFTDVFVFIFIFTVVFLGFASLTNTRFSWKLSFLMFFIFLLSNVIPLLGLLKTNIKKAFANIGETKTLLTMTHTLKILSSILVVCSVSFNFLVISESYSYKKQQSFFEMYQDFYYQDFVFADSSNTSDVKSYMIGMNKAAVMHYRLYKKLFSEGNAVVQSYIGDYELPNKKTYEVLLLNKNAKNSLLEAIPTMTIEQINEEKVYYILPYKPDEEEKNIVFQNLKEYGNLLGFMLYYDYETEIISYDESVRIIGIEQNSLGKSQFYKNPLIIFSNLPEDVMQVKREDIYFTKEPPKGSTSGGYDFEGLGYSLYQNEIMYKITKGDIDALAESHGFNVLTDYYKNTNVYDTYINNREKMQNSLMINSLLSVLLLILEVLVIFTAVKLEYSVNAMEIALKKVLGYSIWQKNKRLFLIGSLTMLFGSIVVIGIGAFLGRSIIFMLLGCCVPILLEISVTLIFIRKMEKTQVIKILKGGAL